MTSLRRLTVCWPHLLPYHDARLRVLAPFLAERDVTLSTLITAGTVPPTPEAYGLEVAFPDEDFRAVPPRETERRITAALDRLDPDAVAITAYSTPDARAALAWCRRRRRVAVMMFDSRREDAPRSLLREWPKRQLVRLFDAALVGGTPHVAYAEELGIPRSHLFTPVDVVDNAFFASRAAAVRSTEGAGPLGLPGPFFLFVGRLAEVKNLPTLIDAYARYRAGTDRPWPLVLVGDGAEREALEARAGAGVVFAGAYALEALPEAYGRAGAFVLPSWKDTWGLVVNEAMASGLPVVVSSGVGCAPDLVRPENGWIFAPDDAAALAAHLGAAAALPEADRAARGARSAEIVARFGLLDFAQGLWDAAQAGRSRADRGASPAGATVLRLLRALSRRTSSFNAIPD